MGSRGESESFLCPGPGALPSVYLYYLGRRLRTLEQAVPALCPGQPELLGQGIQAML